MYLIYFLRTYRKDRLTIQEREKEEQRQEQLKVEAKKAAEERRKYTLKVNVWL